MFINSLPSQTAASAFERSLKNRVKVRIVIQNKIIWTIHMPDSHGEASMVRTGK